MPIDLREEAGGVVIQVRVTPNSSRNEMRIGRNDRIEVRLTTPPVEGRANRALLKFLGKKLHVPPSSITIMRGLSSRDKTLIIADATLASIRTALDLIQGDAP